MKKILAHIPNTIDLALAQSIIASEKSALTLRWIFGAYFLLAALWSWADETASSLIYFGLALLWLLAALVLGMRTKTKLTNGKFLPLLVDFAIVSFGLLLCAWQNIFISKGTIIFLCYFPLLVILATRNNPLLFLQVTGGLLLFYLLLSLFAVDSFSLLRVLMFGVMGFTALTFTRKPKAEIVQTVKALVQEAYDVGAAEKELALINEIHAQFMPPAQHHLPGLYTTYKHGVGTVTSGDFYQTYPHQNGSIILLADLPGAGLQAAFTVSHLHQQISEIVANNPTLSAIANALNQMICNNYQGRKTMSCVLAQWQGANLHYINAGHLPSLRISKREFFRLEANNPQPFGASPEIQFHEEIVDFPKGDLLALYTDGAYSGLANNPADGVDQIERLANEFSSGEVNTICHRIFDCGQPEFSRSADDSTVVLIRRQDYAEEIAV